MTDNLQCDVPKGTEDERVIRSRCMDIVRSVMVIIDRTMNENSRPVVSDYAELMFDPAIDYEEFVEILRQGNIKFPT